MSITLMNIISLCIVILAMFSIAFITAYFFEGKNIGLKIALCTTCAIIMGFFTRLGTIMILTIIDGSLF